MKFLDKHLENLDELVQDKLKIEHCKNSVEILISELSKITLDLVLHKDKPKEIVKITLKIENLIKRLENTC